MRFTPDQLNVLKNALVLALEVRLEDFDNTKNKCDRLAMQEAIRAFRDIKQFNQLLATVEREQPMAG